MHSKDLQEIRGHEAPFLRPVQSTGKYGKTKASLMLLRKSVWPRERPLDQDVNLHPHKTPLGKHILGHTANRRQNNTVCTVDQGIWGVSPNTRFYKAS